MLDIEIDISGFVEEFQLLINESKQLSNAVLDRVVDEYMHNWQRLVGQELNQTKQEYMRAMQVERVDEYNAIIRLNGRESKLALMLEEGADPFDIKEGLKKSSKAKSSLGGDYYIDVPFRFATSKALAASSVFSGVLPKTIEKIAKKASPKSVPQSQLPKQYQKPNTRKAINRGNLTVPKYDHKFSVYAGIRRKQTGKSTGKYMTFRRVSDNSDKYAWYHKGFDARKFMDKVLNELQFDSLVDNVIQNYLDER